MAEEGPLMPAIPGGGALALMPALPPLGCPFPPMQAHILIALTEADIVSSPSAAIPTILPRLFLAGSHSPHQSQMLIVRENIACLADGSDEIHSLFGAQLLDLPEFRLNPGIIRFIGAS